MRSEEDGIRMGFVFFVPAQLEKIRVNFQFAIKI
jgi:hypothetical protein